LAADAAAVASRAIEKKARAPLQKGFLVTLAPHAAIERGRTRPLAATTRKSNRRAGKEEG